MAQLALRRSCLLLLLLLQSRNTDADHWSIGQLGNHNPSFYPGPPLVYATEDCDTWYDAWATRVTDGDGQDPVNYYDSFRQSLQFDVTAERPNLFEIQPAMTDGRGPICPVPGPPPVPVGSGNQYIITGKPMCTRGDYGTGLRGGISELTFKCAADQCGCTTVNAQLFDSGVIDCMVGGTGIMTAPTRIPFCPGGCAPDDCSRSMIHYFTICITCINDCPSFASICDVTVNEDDQNIEILDWAFNIDKGAPNEADQRISFEVTVSNPGLFKVQPYLVWNDQFPGVASLKFEPKEDVFGSSEFCVTMFDDGGDDFGGCNAYPMSNTAWSGSTKNGFCCKITVNPINDCPTFRPNGQQDGGSSTPNGEIVTVQEDAGRVVIPRWASNISPGAAFGESVQNLWFNLAFVDNNQRVMFSEVPHIDPNTGDLIFQLAPDMNTLGQTLEIYVQLQDDGGRVPPPSCDVSCSPIDTCPKLVIVVEDVNDPPFFIPGGDISVCEDLADNTPPPVPAVYCYPQWASRISPGAERERVMNGGEGQTVSFEIVNDDRNSFLFANGPTINEATGDLCFELAENQYGTAEVGVTIVDSGPFDSTGANGPGLGSNRGTSTFVRVTVKPSNDGPTYTVKDFSDGLPANPDACLVVDYKNDFNNVNRGQFSIEDFLTDITRGGSARNEAGGQKFVEIEVEPLTDDGLMLQQKYFSATPVTSFTSGTSARLSFTLKEQMNNPAATIYYRVRVRDTGGGAGSGAQAGSCGSQDYTDDTFCITILEDRTPSNFTVVSNNLCVLEDSPNNFFTLSKTLPHKIPNFFLGLNMACEHVELRLGNNSELFLIAPAAGTGSTAGTLTFTLAKDMFGSAEVYATVVNTCLNPQLRSSPPLKFTICVQACNDPPEFTLTSPNALLTDLSECDTATSEKHNKNCCEYYFPRFAQAISAGPFNEVGQGYSFLVDVSNFGTNSPFVVPPEIARTGGLSFCLKPNVNVGFSQIAINLIDDGGGSGCNVNKRTVLIPFQIGVTNDPPSFVPGNEIILTEDESCDASTINDCLTTIPSWARNMSPGEGADEVNQELSFECRPVDTDIIRSCKADAVSGTITLNIPKHAFGKTSLELVLYDGVPGGYSAPVVVPITILSVNDPPSFDDVGRIVTVFEDSCYSQRWVVNPASIGPDNEAPQFLTYFLTESNANAVGADFLFKTQPRINSDGILIFCLNPDVHGTFAYTVVAQDNGGVLRGGVDISETHVLDIVVIEVNDCPTMALSSAYDQRVALTAIEDERNGEVFFTHVISAVSPGAENEKLQQTRVLAFATPPEAFQVQPYLIDDIQTSEIGRGLTLKGVLTQHYFGVVEIELRATDTGSGVNPNCNKSEPIKLVLVVDGRNDPPTFDIGPPIVTIEDAPGFVYPMWAQNVTSGPLNERYQGLNFTVTPKDFSLFTYPPVLDVRTGGMSFELAPNKNGKTDITVCLTDTGRLEEGVNEKCLESSITVLPESDIPTLLAANGVTLDITTDEDSGENFIEKWIIQNEVSESIVTAVNITVPGEATRLFTEMPVLVRNEKSHTYEKQSYGVRFTPAPDAFGAVTLLLGVSAVEEQSAIFTQNVPFTLTVRPVNDPPVFSLLTADVAILEDGSPKSFLVLTNISAGPAEDVTQTVQFSFTAVSPDFASAFDITAGSDGKVLIAPKADQHGVFTVLVSATDSEGLSSDTTQQKEIKVYLLPVNDKPVFVPDVTTVTIREDSGANALPSWAQGISAGVGEEGQLAALQFGTTFSGGSGAELFTTPPNVQVQPNTNFGSLLLEPASNRYGTVEFSIFAFDAGLELGAATLAEYEAVAQRNGIDSYTSKYTTSQSSETVPVTVTITAVNDPPTGQPFPDVTSPGNPILRVLEDAGETTIPDVFRNVSAGGWGEDETQHLVFTATPFDPSLFLVQPRIVIDKDPASPTVGRRDLVFQTHPQKNGETAITLKITDPFGAVSGTVNGSVSNVVNLIVLAVNDPPLFLSGADIRLNEDERTNLVFRSWATEITPGPDDEKNQKLTFTTTLSDEARGVIKTLDIDPATGDLTLDTFSDSFGSFSVNVTLNDDGGSLNGGKPDSEVRILKIDVDSVNDPPLFAQLVFQVDVSVDAAPYSVRWAHNVLPGPENEVGEGQTVSWVVSTTETRFFAAGGQPASSPDGDLTFALAGDRVGNATLQLQARDSLNLLSKVAVVHINVIPPTSSISVLAQRAVDANGAPIVSEAVLQERLAAAIGIPPTALVMSAVTNSLTRIFFLSSPGVTAEEARNRFMGLTNLRDLGISSWAITDADTLPPNSVEFTLSPNSTTSVSSGGGDTIEDWLLAVLIVGAILLVAAAVAGSIWGYKKAKQNKTQKKLESTSSAETPSRPSQIMYPEQETPVFEGREIPVYESPMSQQRLVHNPIEGAFHGVGPQPQQAPINTAVPPVLG